VTSSQRSGWLEGTAAFIEKTSQNTSMRPLAHLACTAGTREELIGWINRLVDAGVRGLLALRGDLPEGGMPEHYLQHADELVR
ncbi:methylenetetrahydrofolate reductase, partial [Klebsiella pneumoniae]|uniref:methylenetetrahydrofolate reductase n=1 Tax=Klebsiella pneumoniae TaxID=573 RepID=UPI003D05E1D9